MSKLKKTTLYINGMHCPSCEVLMEDKFKEEKNIKEVKADFRKQMVEIRHTGEINTDLLNLKIHPFGYQIQEKEDFEIGKNDETFVKKIIDVLIISIIFFILYLIIKEANLIPEVSLGGNLNYVTVFVLGLIASTSTCMATSGVLFLATIGKQKNKNFTSAFLFNFGRILSYGFFGFLAGLIGKVFATELNIGSILILITAFFMILLGLDMAKILSFASVIPTGFMKSIFQKLEHRLIKNPRKTAMFLGAITYFLPCGFTQTMQIYVLGLANPIESALTMMIFAIGTMPVLLIVGAIVSLTRSRYYLYFIKTIGVLVFFIGISYFINFLSLYGININFFPASNTINSFFQDESQVVKMNVNSSGYSPNLFTIKKGIPVKWIINGENVFGCQGYLIVPKFSIRKTLTPGKNIIEFTPKETGTINFSCGMGMYRGRFEVKK